MKTTQYRIGRCYDLAFDLGEDIDRAVAELCRRENIDTGVITAGLGGFGRFCLSFPEPEGRSERSWQNVVLQLSSVQGDIINGRPELSAVVTVDGNEPLTWAGRVEPGSERLFYCELMLTELLPDSD